MTESISQNIRYPWAEANLEIAQNLEKETISALEKGALSREELNNRIDRLKTAIANYSDSLEKINPIFGNKTYHRLLGECVSLNHSRLNFQRLLERTRPICLDQNFITPESYRRSLYKKSM